MPTLADKERYRELLTRVCAEVDRTDKPVFNSSAERLQAWVQGRLQAGAARRVKTPIQTPEEFLNVTALTTAVKEHNARRLAARNGQPLKKRKAGSRPGPRGGKMFPRAKRGQLSQQQQQQQAEPVANQLYCDADGVPYPYDFST